MRVINKPALLAEEVFLTCVSRVRDAGLKTRLTSIADSVRAASVDYDARGISGQLYMLQQHDNIDGIVSKEEMEKVYKDRMAKQKTPGRTIYDVLRGSSPQGICPLCGQRVVMTLDHYLPKANFPVFSVVPYNLVPACSDCNKIKLNEVPQHANQQTLHPYYDDVTNEQWIYAEVIEDDLVAIRFFVQSPVTWDQVLKDRVSHHFDILKLGELYAAQAGTELANIRYRLNELHNAAGAETVSEHLQEEAVSRQRAHVNSWQTAMYQAISFSEWFCDGGFRNI